MQCFPSFWTRFASFFLESSLGLSFCGEYFALLVMSSSLNGRPGSTSGTWFSVLVHFAVGFFSSVLAGAVLTVLAGIWLPPSWAPVASLPARRASPWPTCPPHRHNLPRLISFAPQATPSFSVSSLLSETVMFHISDYRVLLVPPSKCPVFMPPSFGSVTSSCCLVFRIFHGSLTAESAPSGCWRHHDRQAWAPLSVLASPSVRPISSP